MTKSKKNPFKEEREWKDLLNMKKAYLLRKQEEEESKKRLKHWRVPKDEDDPTDEV